MVENKYLPNSIKLVVLLFGVITLTGCSKPIPPENMIPTQMGNEFLIYSGPFYQSISVDNVGGGEETNPMMFSEIGNPELKKAIINSLRRYNYYALTAEDAKYILNVFLIDIKRPTEGYTTIVTIFVRYKLTEIKNNKVVLDEIIKASDIKTVEEVFVGPTRLRITQQEAMKRNISEFIKMLFSLNDKVSTVN